jgi:uncharacterized protein YqeY
MSKVSVKKAADDKVVTEFEFENHGVDAEQYFQGVSAGSDWDEVFVGIGDSEKQAAEDAAENASQGYDISKVEKEIDKEIAAMSEFDEVLDTIKEYAPDNMTDEWLEEYLKEAVEEGAYTQEEADGFIEGHKSLPDNIIAAWAEDEGMQDSELHCYVALYVKAAGEDKKADEGEIDPERMKDKPTVYLFGIYPTVDLDITELTRILNDYPDSMNSFITKAEDAGFYVSGVVDGVENKKQEMEDNLR